MREKRGARRLCVLAAAVVIGALFPAAAQAETHTFFKLGHFFPSNGGLSGPANVYPSSVTVSGLSGTVTKATVSVIDYESGSPADTDMAIVGPNGQAVMLMSDACGTTPTSDDNWTFDDSAPTFLPSSCGPGGQDASFKPSNPGDPTLDDLTPGGGPPQPYLNSLSFLAGGSPNGTWSLFAFDDNAAAIGFVFNGWALTLDVQPPAAAPAATGQRAAALAKCKRKKSKKARRKCRQKAQSLPL